MTNKKFEQADQGKVAISDRILARAREMVPVLRERAALAESLRRIPDETVEDFRQADFYRILQPMLYGGLELDYGVQADLAIILAEGCASSAWDANITACHAWLLGMYPAEAQNEVWGDNPETMVSTSFLPADITVRRVDGGIRLGGRWKFSSGVGHCEWAMLAVAVEAAKGDETKEHYLALLRLSECAVEDTWFATGLSGTGSNDIVVEDRFVPEHRILRVMGLRGEPSPGSAVNPFYIYRLPLYGVFAFNLVGTAIGAARGMINQVIERISARTLEDGATLAAQQSVQLRISEATAEVDAAHAVVARNLDEVVRIGRAGEDFDLLTKARYRRDNGFASKLAVRAVDRVYPLIGGRGLASDDAANRTWRDVHAVAQHLALTWDVQAQLHGAIALGLPSIDPRL